MSTGRISKGKLICDLVILKIASEFVKVIFYNGFNHYIFTAVSYFNH